MKIGDRLYCINNYISAGKIVNTKGQTYTIINIENSHICVDTNFKNNNCDKNEFILGNKSQYYNLYHYFIDLKKERKLKLNKLNENR